MQINESTLIPQNAQNLVVCVSGICLEIEITHDLENITHLFKELQKNTEKAGSPLGRFRVYNSEKRDIIFDKINKTLDICGPEIDNLKDPFNLIGLLQALFRFVAYIGVTENIALLHGSSVVFKDKTIFFGDDSESTAKTLSSLECGLKSQQYVTDEFTFINLDNFEVSGYDFVPVHIRPIVEEHLKKEFDFEKVFQSDDFEDSVAGKFIYPKNLFKKIILSPKLDLVIYTHFVDSEEETGYHKLEGNEMYEAMQANMLAHIMKLIYPSLDRMQFKSTNDTHDEVEYNREFLNNLTSELGYQKKIKTLINKVESYKIYVSSPSQIPQIVEQIIMSK